MTRGSFTALPLHAPYCACLAKKHVFCIICHCCYPLARYTACNVDTLSCTGPQFFYLVVCTYRNGVRQLRRVASCRRAPRGLEGLLFGYVDFLLGTMPVAKLTRALKKLKGLQAMFNHKLSYPVQTSMSMLPGEPGRLGARGSRGATGPEGYPGPTGSGGRPGLMGRPGLPGDEGDRGLKGLLGIQGNQGSNGVKGVEGPPGPRGNIGFKGAIGLPGPSGYTGDNGPAGQDGQTGGKGKPGSAPAGLDGADGGPGA